MDKATVGYGKVTAIDGNKLMIDFEMGSPRKVMDSNTKKFS